MYINEIQTYATDKVTRSSFLSSNLSFIIQILITLGDVTEEHFC